MLLREPVDNGVDVEPGRDAGVRPTGVTRERLRASVDGCASGDPSAHHGREDRQRAVLERRRAVRDLHPVVEDVRASTHLRHPRHRGRGPCGRRRAARDLPDRDARNAEAGGKVDEKAPLVASRLVGCQDVCALEGDAAMRGDPVELEARELVDEPRQAGDVLDVVGREAAAVETRGQSRSGRGASHSRRPPPGTAHVPPPRCRRSS